MKFGIGAKLGVLASALIIATGVVLALVLVSWSKDVLIRHELVDLGDETHLRAEELVGNIQALREDALAQAGRSHFQEFLRAPSVLVPLYRRRVEGDFQTLLKDCPHYLQVEFLPREGGDRPAVRVARPGQNVRVNSAAHLGHLPDKDTFETNRVLLSPPHRDGAVRRDGEPVPVMRAAVPLFTTGSKDAADDTQLAGLLVITMDFGPLAERLTRSVRHLTYLTDEEGRLLLRPAPDRAFVFVSEGRAARIYDESLLPALKKFYTGEGLGQSEVLAVSTGNTYSRGFRYPNEDWHPKRDVHLLTLRVRDPEVWKQARDVHRDMKARLNELGRRYEVFVSPSVDELTADVHVRGGDRAAVEAVGDTVMREFGEYLVRRPVIDCDAFAVHFYRVPYSPRGRDEPRWLGLAQAVAYDEITADITEMEGELLWIKAALIGTGVLAALLLAGLITRPLKRIMAATREIARGNFDVELPVKASGEVGALALCFRDMVGQLRQRDQDLRRLNEELDQRVQARTKQLEKLNHELAAARDQALEASQAKSVFLAQMSHELRTPLNAVKGYSELLLEEAEDRGLPEFVPDLRKIIDAGQHLLALINDVLDLSKIEADKIELFLESFDVKEMVSGGVGTIKPLLAKNGNNLDVKIDDDVGPMHADRTRVRQVLFNLLSNAAKFTHQGEVGLAVLRERADGRDWYVFHVRDTGIGIKPEELSRLFQPFVQADASTTRKYGGTGLGLTISRSFARMMGGDIAVESEYGKGSVFTLRMPAEVTGAKPADTGQSDGAPRGSCSTVLVIDDDPVVRDLMERFLGKEGFRSVAASNGQEGVRLAKELKPLAVTLDVMMPGMDGWDVLTALKADPETADIPVIMQTIVDDKNLGYALGATEYFTKPIDRDRLARLLKKYREECQSQSVLVVEDDANTREVVRRGLERDGWSVREAENGRAALERLREDAPSLILLDLMMPEMDGFELIAHLRDNPSWRGIPVVVLTAKELTAADRATLSGSVRRVLQKGAHSRDEMLGEVRELVAGCLKNGTEE